MVTWYRLQDADRDPRELLDPAHQWSCDWGGSGDPRRGVSVCGTEDMLARYFAAHADAGFDPEFLATLVLVEVEGDLSDEDDQDADQGAYVVIPTRVVSVGPVPADMVTTICRGA